MNDPVKKQNDELARSTAIGQVIEGELAKAPNKAELLAEYSEEEFIISRVNIYWETYFQFFDQDKDHFIAQERAMEDALSCFPADSDSTN